MGSDRDALGSSEQHVAAVSGLHEVSGKELLRSDRHGDPAAIGADVVAEKMVPTTRKRRSLSAVAVTALIVAVIFPPAGLALSKTARHECLATVRAA